MLTLPDNRMPRSIKMHNIAFEYLCDWIEGSILFDETEDEFSVMDVVDILISEEIYNDQDFAEQIVLRRGTNSHAELNMFVPTDHSP